MVACLLGLVALTGSSTSTFAGAVIQNLIDGCAASLPRNDDGSMQTSAACDIGFPVNFFGQTYTSLFVNNNGNVTFDSALGTFTPFGLATTDRKIIAPFFADVDTRGTVSNVVRYGQCSIDISTLVPRPQTEGGVPCFAVEWVGVGHFNQTRTDPPADTKLNSFQMVLVDLSSITDDEGDFGIVFNYDAITWETGDASGGTNGLGGSSARVGFSDGQGSSGNFNEFAGSGVPGSLLDSAATGLSRNLLNGSPPVAGRYKFGVRGGSIKQADLAIAMTADPPRPVVGGDLRYHIRVTNNGPDTASDVSIADPIPAQLTYVDSDTPACVSSQGSIECPLDDLTNGTHMDVTLHFTVTTAGNIGNSVGVVSETLDPDIDNNVASIVAGGTECRGEILSQSKPETVKYRSERKTFYKTMKLAIINNDVRPIEITDIRPLPDRPFVVVKTNPALPFTIDAGKGKTFKVRTARSQGLPNIETSRPYFTISLRCVPPQGGEDRETTIVSDDGYSDAATKRLRARVSRSGGKGSTAGR